MFKRIFPAVSAALLSALLVGGCLSKSPVADMPTIITKVADFTIELSYIGRDLLVQRHGSNLYYDQNPYVDYPGRMPPKNIIVFDTVLTTLESTVLVELDDVRLIIEGEGGKAVSVLYMQSLWRGYAEDDGRGWPKILRATKDYMLPEEMEVTPGNPLKGYLVFPYGYPKEGGRGLLTVIASTPDGGRGTIDIPIRFSGYGVIQDTGAEENSGIFAQESQEPQKSE